MLSLAGESSLVRLLAEVSILTPERIAVSLELDKKELRVSDHSVINEGKSKKGRSVIDCCVCLFVTRGMFLPRERMNAVEKFKRELIT